MKQSSPSGDALYRKKKKKRKKKRKEKKRKEKAYYSEKLLFTSLHSLPDILPISRAPFVFATISSISFRQCFGRAREIIDDPSRSLLRLLPASLVDVAFDVARSRDTVETRVGFSKGVREGHTRSPRIGRRGARRP